MTCCDCGEDDSYTKLPNGKLICRSCYSSRANNPLDKNFGHIGYGCCTPVAVQSQVQSALDEEHRRAVAASGIPCGCDRCLGKASEFVFP